MIGKHFKADPLLVPRLHWRLWAITTILAVAGPSVYQWQSHWETKRMAQYERLAAASRQRIDQVLASTHARYNVRLKWANTLRDLVFQAGVPWISQAVDRSLAAWPPSAPTREEAEKALNNGFRFQTTRVTRDWGCPCHGSGPQSYDMAVYAPSDGGPGLSLYFAGNSFVNAEDPALPAFNPLWGLRACRWVHEHWQRWGPKLWLFMVALPFILRRHRVVLAELLTVVALLLVVATWPTAAVIPGIQAWQSLAQNADVAWAMFMASTSASILVWAVLRQSNLSRILCPLCGYNLRGNAVGCCPECGTAIPQEIRDRLAAFPIKRLSPTA